MTPTPAGCYGKLPIHGDFIRHRPLLPEIDFLDEWIQAGIVSSRQPMGAAWEASFDATPPARFLLSRPPGRRAMAGVLTASRDRTGRRYPFMVYTSVDTGSAGSEVTFLPASLSAFLGKAQEAAVSGWQGKDLRTFQGLVDGLAPAADLDGARQAVRQLVEKQTNGSFWSEMFGSGDDPRKYLLVHDLVEVLGSGTVPRFALRFPRVSGEAEVCFWLELTRRVARRPGLPTVALWGSGRDGGPPSLTLIFDDLMVKYFLPLLWPERKSDHLMPLAAPRGPGDARLQVARERYGRFLDDGSASLINVMLRLAAL